MRGLWSRLKNNHMWWATVVSMLLSIIALIVYAQSGLIVAYGDSESHLNIAKRVVSSMTPGFGQLGGNWPPLHHVAMLPFIWSDYLWRTGLAGSVVSMACYVLSCVLMFKLIRQTLRYNRAAWLGMLLFALNPAVLYMQVTAMSELPMLLSLIGATYYFAKWVSSENAADIMTSAVFVFGGSLIRYDSWALSCICVVALFAIWFIKQRPLKQFEGVAIFFSVISFAGIALWILWNKLIFNDPFYFMSSPYSAKSQQEAWMAKGVLPSYHNWASSYEFYTLTVLRNSGYIAAAAAVVGLVILLWYALKGRYNRAHLVSLLLLFSPFPFYVLTLYMGISIILLPEALPKNVEFNLFNVRYGMMMIPFIAACAAVIVARYPKFGFLVVGLVLIAQTYAFHAEGDHIVIRDAKYGLSARRPSPVNQFVARKYDNGLVMFDDFSRSANPIDLGIPMSKIVYVGNHPIWDESLAQPEKHIKWLIIRRDENDVLWQKYRKDPQFSEKYQMVYNWQKTGVYRKWDAGTTPAMIDLEKRKVEELLKNDNTIASL